jgi:hypothetical protein
LHKFKDQYRFLFISRSVILSVWIVSDISSTENQNTHFMLSNFFSRKTCLLWGCVEKYYTVRQTTDNTAHKHCMLITKATNTPSKYVIIIVFKRNNRFANAPQCYVLYVHCQLLNIVEILILPERYSNIHFRVPKTLCISLSKLNA